MVIQVATGILTVSLHVQNTSPSRPPQFSVDIPGKAGVHSLHTAITGVYFCVVKLGSYGLYTSRGLLALSL